MAMLNRPTNIKIFGSAALAAELTDFGGSTPSTDINTILNSVAAERGWGTVGANGFPPMEWFNALGYALSYYSAYIMQSGIPAWTSLQNYYVNSYAVGSDGKLYRSKTGIDGTPNVGNNPVGDTTNWESTLDMAGLIHSSTAKTTPVDADEFGIWDSVSGLLKKITTANLTAFLSTLFAKQSQLVGFKNYIINGNFDVWQHGTSFTGLSNSGSTVTADMARYSSANSGQTAAFTVSQSTDAPSGSTYSLQVACTTAQGVLNSADSACIYLPVEGQSAKGLYGKNASVSFKFKTTLIGTYDIVIATNDRAYVKQIIVTDTNWNTYSFSLLIDSSTGTWNRDTSLGFVMSIKLLAGSSRLITANTWASGSGLSGSSGSVNFANSTSNIMKISQIQIEEGSIATPFEQRPYGLELSLCQRYYQKFGNDTSALAITGLYSSGASNGLSFPISLPVPMRVIPTVSSLQTASSNVSSASVVAISNRSLDIRPVATAAGLVAISYTSQSSYITASAEL